MSVKLPWFLIGRDVQTFSDEELLRKIHIIEKERLPKADWITSQEEKEEFIDSMNKGLVILYTELDRRTH